jgi:hypothetical protein
MLPWSDVLVRQQRALNLLREAEQECLARQALADRGQRRAANRMRSWLGQRLVAWGTRLQKRDRSDAGALAARGEAPRREATA